MAVEQLFAGVDGGATKTQAVIVNQAGEEVSRAVSGSGNYQAVGLERAVGHTIAAVRGAAIAAGSDTPIAAAWIGLAGIDRPADRTILQPFLAPLAEKVRLTNDAELGLAALRGGFGITVI